MNQLTPQSPLRDEFKLTELVYKPTVGLKTGISKLDDQFQFSPGFHLIVGSPGSGKSWLATWLVLRFWLFNKTKSVLFSLEMGEKLLVNRLLQQWSSLTEQEIKTNEPNAGVDYLKQEFLKINSLSARTPASFIVAIERYIQEGFTTFLIDHIHQIPYMKDAKRNGEISALWGETFEKLRDKHPNITLIVLAQPIKSAFHKVALQMQDISDSAPLIYKADSFVSISADEEREITKFIDKTETTRYRIIWIDKNRLTGKSQMGVRLYFAPDANFYESEASYHESRSLLESFRTNSYEV